MQSDITIQKEREAAIKIANDIFLFLWVKTAKSLYLVSEEYRQGDFGELFL